ncbi:hypothetical protein C8A03DRAFT_15102 [Achaetomium macrosporum]|uniref:Uncharacterized protein n=1 Tax=Achaetomium macrosporum TaxID=79813 RepID=A0AAN7CBQ4_9PEZI|nr:hypothetical protein C8A03DRAFT_15102 [Achaetomium macrosporum]
MSLNMIQGQSRLAYAVVSIGVISGAAFLGKRKLDRTCPRVPVSALPKHSAARTLIQNTGEPTGEPAWGLKRSTLLSSWLGNNDDKTRWISSFAALQVEVPVASLARYGALCSSKDDGTNERDNTDTFRLMQGLVAAFLDALREGPEGWLLDRDVPPLSFTPGSHLFGDKSGLGAFVLYTWASAARGKYPQHLALPEDIPQPVSEFPSVREVIHGDDPTDAAGTVMYWSVPDGTIRVADKVASYGLPWRPMQGGFQEFIVEKVSDKMARVTYTSVECSNFHPGQQPARDFKRMPWLGYELHVLYAQYLLYSTVRRLKVQARRLEEQHAVLAAGVQGAGC